MARIAGVDIPNNKQGQISLTYIYGIGRSLAKEILAKAGVDPEKKVQALVCLHPSHWPPVTTHSSKVQLSHLCENSSDTWQTGHFPSPPQTHRTSLSEGMPGTPMSIPSQDSLRQAGVCSYKGPGVRPQSGDAAGAVQASTACGFTL